MNTKEWAEKLDGREYRCETTYQEEEQMKQDGIVAVYGASDDLCELRGAVDEEYDCFGGSEISIESIKIRIVWHDEGYPCWTFETDIPHETFDIYEDGELYCKSIIFNLSDCKKPKTNFEKIKAMNAEELAGFIAAITGRCKNMSHEFSQYVCVFLDKSYLAPFNDKKEYDFYYRSFKNDIRAVVVMDGFIVQAVIMPIIQSGEKLAQYKNFASAVYAELCRIASASPKKSELEENEYDYDGEL